MLFLYSYLYIVCFYQGVMEQTYLIVELLAGEIFYSLREAQILAEMWRKQYNAIKSHSSRGFQLTAMFLQTPQIQFVALS